MTLASFQTEGREASAQKWQPLLLIFHWSKVIKMTKSEVTEARECSPTLEGQCRMSLSLAACWECCSPPLLIWMPSFPLFVGSCMLSLLRAFLGVATSWASHMSLPASSDCWAKPLSEFTFPKCIGLIWTFLHIFFFLNPGICDKNCRRHWFK